MTWNTSGRGDMHGIEASHNPSSSNLQKKNRRFNFWGILYASFLLFLIISFLLSRFLCKSKVRVFRLLSKWPRRAILRSGEIIDLKVIPLIYFRNQGIKFFSIKTTVFWLSTKYRERYYRDRLKRSYHRD